MGECILARYSTSRILSQCLYRCGCAHSDGALALPPAQVAITTQCLSAALLLPMLLSVLWFKRWSKPPLRILLLLVGFTFGYDLFSVRGLVLIPEGASVAHG